MPKNYKCCCLLLSCGVTIFSSSLNVNLFIESKSIVRISFFCYYGCFRHEVTNQPLRLILLFLFASSLKCLSGAMVVTEHMESDPSTDYCSSICVWRVWRCDISCSGIRYLFDITCRELTHEDLLSLYYYWFLFF